MPGIVDGLPVGMMLVAKAFNEETIHRAAAAFENRLQLEIAGGGRLTEMAQDDPGVRVRDIPSQPGRGRAVRLRSEERQALWR
jgi:hypothetical protein